MDPILWELLAEGSPDDYVDVLIRLSDLDVHPAGRIEEVARIGNIASCRIRRGDIMAIRGMEGVFSMKGPRIMAVEPPYLEYLPEPTGEYADKTGAPRRPEAPFTGRGVALGLADSGIDVTHSNFRHADGSSRFIALWDQEAKYDGMNPYGYGAIHYKKAINQALRSEFPFQELGRHPGEKDVFHTGMHGSHVLDIAAGNGAAGEPGVAPDADLIGVNLITPRLKGPMDLGDSVSLFHALHFMSTTVKNQPLVICLCLGTHGDAHAGCSLIEQAIDHLVTSNNGIACIQSCGNYHAGRTHASGVLSQNGSHTLEWLVSERDKTPNEMEIWFEEQDEVLISLISPEGRYLFQDQGLGQRKNVDDSGEELCRFYYRDKEPSTSLSQAVIMLTEHAPFGKWQVMLKGKHIVQGRFEAWIERDFRNSYSQSRFPNHQADTNTTTGSICNGFHTICVGAYDHRDPQKKIGFFSSVGPTWDGRDKPDFVCPGVRILAARSASPYESRSAGELTFKTGTSMAAPWAAGAVCLLYEAAGKPLSIQEVKSRLHQACRPPVYDNPAERKRFGHGILDLELLLADFMNDRYSGQPIIQRKMDEPFLNPVITPIETLLETCQAQYPELMELDPGALFAVLLRETEPEYELDIRRGDILFRRWYGHHKPALYGVVDYVYGNDVFLFTPQGHKKASLSKDGGALGWEWRRIRPDYSRVSSRRPEPEFYETERAEVFMSMESGRPDENGQDKEADQALFERLAEPRDTIPDQPTRLPPHFVVIDETNKPLAEGEYAFHQKGGSVRGRFTKERAGFAFFDKLKIDPSQPFLFEVPGRVCAIRTGAFFDPDGPELEYGGAWFDWTLVRDDKDAEKGFWPYYHREMDWAAKIEAYAEKITHNRPVVRFLQHEHITRRPIQVARPFLGQLGKVQIQATPVQIRVGPFVRYTDHERAVIWLEVVSPAMVHVRYNRPGGTELSRYSCTVRVGGRYFTAVELDALEEDKFYNYTIELAPLPATGAIPIDQKDFADIFPKLSPAVSASMKKQLSVPSIDETEWLAFRTLRRKYDKKLRFATGSCRWFPGDKKNGKEWGPDMLHGLGNWLILNPKKEWPYFLFFGGDQIYADEVGDNHAEMMIQGRFASRIPGPADPAGATRDKLIDGAWAGRFAHRYREYKEYSAALYTSIESGLEKLDEIYRKYPDIKGIYKEYPEADPREKLKWRYRVLKNRREVTGASREASDERKAREAVALLPTVDNLEVSVEPFRAFVPHWKAAFNSRLRQNPMGYRYLSHNLLLWKIPDFEHQLPGVSEHNLPLVRKPNGHGHPSVDGGKHAADFAEYAYMYERAWTTSRSVRVLLAQVPTFLMFDDHEATDDWNFDAAWARMLHNDKDDFRMWPKTLTDGLAAYWMYQAWCNKAPSQWAPNDPRIVALNEARRTGTDALPALRRSIHQACFTPAPPKDTNASYQTGLTLDWHYKLPFDPPFLVPDCRTRRFMVPSDNKIRVIDHGNPAKRPESQTIDKEQLRWLHKHLIADRPGGPVAFIAPSTPLIMQKKVMSIMRMPEIAARAWAQGADLASLGAAIFDSPRLGSGSNELLHVFRKARDLEHMIRDRSWRDMWGLIAAMQKANSSVKTVVLVSGDVHHSYCMTANLPGSGRPRPELVQITSSGLQTTIRKDFKTSLAEALSKLDFKVGKYRLVPGFVSKNDSGSPDLVLYENAVALVEVSMGREVSIVVTYLANKDKHVYRYTSGASYMIGGIPAVLAKYLGRSARGRVF